MMPSRQPPPAPAPANDSEAEPGLPGFRTWRGVYVAVLGCFVVVVVLLALFTRAYSG